VIDLETAALRYPGAAIAIGTFDGVHLAHRALIREVRARARALATRCLALTFDPHPKELLLKRAPPRLTGAEEKYRRLLAAGAEVVVVLRFDAELARLPAPEFVGRILTAKLAARMVAVGFNFSFGEGGKGRPEDLERLARAAGIEARVIEALDIDGIPVSSTGIRELIACGDVAEAAARLGEPHALTGTVVKGDQRGRELGFPTANLALEPANLLAPKVGVYAGRARVAGKVLPAVINVGSAPTFVRGREIRVEVHCLEPPGCDLYGRPLAAELVDRLRDELRFDGPEPLRAQIAADIRAAKARLEADRVRTASLPPARPDDGTGGP
jgi:riboflavin kinase/FMN adenylyltransferase